MIIEFNKIKSIPLLIICFSFIFPINTLAQSFIDDASHYTVRFRVLVDHPFIEDSNEDEVVKSWSGAGFVVDKLSGLIVTNAHVSGVGNTFIKIAFKGERFIKGELIYVDPELDIALVKVKPKQMPDSAKAGILSCNKKIENGTARIPAGLQMDCKSVAITPSQQHAAYCPAWGALICLSDDAGPSDRQL